MRRVLVWTTVLLLLVSVSAACVVVPVPAPGPGKHDRGQHRGWHKQNRERHH